MSFTGRKIKFGNRYIGEDSPCYIIAEMSANHAGNFDKAVEIIHTAKEAGADCLKIQTYTADTLTIDCDNEYFHIGEGTWKGENLYNLYRKAHTPWEWQERLKEETEKAGLDFLSTAYDNSSVDFLERMGVKAYKIASFELVDIPLIKYIASKQKPIFLSTGMASLSEIEEAVNAVKSEGNKDLILLKCCSSYPAVEEDMNLLTMQNLYQVFGTVVGLSDHTLGTVSAIAAVAMGAKVIEKHFCLSRMGESADSSFSMEPEEFAAMVKDVRIAEKAIGTVNYELSPKEKININFRKSIFVVKDIKAGEPFTSENIRVIRPAYGLEPKYYDYILGKKASQEIKRGTPLEWKFIKKEV
ncbi:MAG: pseudaminic acid synthase [Clostridia bacterium]